MIGLVMLGAIINYLTRSTLAVAAPTLLKDLRISAQEYSWIVGTFQIAIMLQPICGYVLDVLGLKRGLAIFATAWSLISMAHGLAHNWPMLAALRGLLGFAEGLGQPGGHEGDRGVVSRAGARPGRRRLQHRRLGGLDAGAAAGGVGDPHLQLADGVCHHGQPGPGLGRAVAVAVSIARDAPAALGRRARAYRRRTGVAPARRRPAPVDRPHRPAAQLLGHRAAAVSRGPDLGHADLLGAALPHYGAALRPEADCAVCVDAVSGRRPRMSVWRRPGAWRCRSAA